MTLFNDNQDFTLDPSKNYLEDLVGEGKKYKDEQALAYSRVEADAFIERLKRENAEMRSDFMRLKEEHDAVPRLQELIDRLSKQPDATSNNHSANAEDNKPVIDMKEIEGLLESKYESLRTKERQEANLRSAQSKLKERYGENAQTHLETQMNSLGLSKDFVENLAKENPRAFEQIFLPKNSGETFEAPPHSTQRSDPFAPAVKARNWSYYEDIRKKDATLYWSPKIQNQMHLDNEKLGDAFFK